MLIPVLLFLLGLVLLIKGGDWFVDGATGIAKRFHLSELLIGATVVSIGTTLPEVMVSSQAAAIGNSGISYGNAIGSIICNTSLIAALTIAIRPSVVNKRALRIPVAVFFVVAAAYACLAYLNHGFSRWNGILFLVLFVAYIIFTVYHMKQNPEGSEDAADESEQKERKLWVNFVFLIVGAAAIAFGARLLVERRINISPLSSRLR